MEPPKKRGNPNIREISKLSTGPNTEFGLFMFKVKQTKLKNVPRGMKELYRWYKKFNTTEVNTLIELKNSYEHLKADYIQRIAQRKISGENITKTDLAMFKLIKDTLVDIHKLIHGEKKTVKHEVTIDDVRDIMFSEKAKKVIEVEPDGKISQDLDRS